MLNHIQISFSFLLFLRSPAFYRIIGITVISFKRSSLQMSPHNFWFRWPCAARIGVINVACRPKPSAAFSSVQQPLLLEKQWKNLPASSFLVATALFLLIYLHLKFEFFLIKFIFNSFIFYSKYKMCVCLFFTLNRM